MKLLVAAVAATALLFGSIGAGMAATAGADANAGVKTHMTKKHVSAKTRTHAKAKAKTNISSTKVRSTTGSGASMKY